MSNQEDNSNNKWELYKTQSSNYRKKDNNYYKKDNKYKVRIKIDNKKLKKCNNNYNWLKILLIFVDWILVMIIILYSSNLML